MYEIIDETLKIASCGINDLTLEQASSFLSQWEDGATLGSLTLFIKRNNKRELVAVKRSEKVKKGDR